MSRHIAARTTWLTHPPTVACANSSISREICLVEKRCLGWNRSASPGSRSPSHSMIPQPSCLDLSRCVLACLKLGKPAG
jgi:hypothetical protein